MSSPNNLCSYCSNVRWDETEQMDEMKAHCAAFPKGIPQEILMNIKDHRKSIKGDNGIIFSSDMRLTNEEIDSLFELNQ